MSFVLGIVVLVLVLWALHVLSRSDPRRCGRSKDRRRAERVGDCGRARRAWPDRIAVPLGLTGLGLLGWLPWSMPGFGARTRKSPGQVSRVSSAFVEMELDHDTGAMRDVFLPGGMKASPSKRSMCRR